MTAVETEAVSAAIENVRPASAAASWRHVSAGAIDQDTTLRRPQQRSTPDRMLLTAGSASICSIFIFTATQTGN